jgi:ribonucleoside-diphosphate reductase alpha subunit
METSLQNEMLVTKRNGDLETIEFDKILKRLKSAGQEVGIQINYTALVMKVIDQLYDKIPTTKIDDLTAEQCASMSSIHTDYNILAGRIVISNHHKNTSNSFSEVMSKLYNYSDKQDKSSPLISKELYEISQKFSIDLDKLCNYNQDYLIDYFGFKTLEKSYLMRINGKIMERPQHMWLRVAIGIHSDNMEKVYETYNYMSNKYFTHATPTLFNAGTPRPQNSSCFLQSMESDSIEGIYNTLKDCALISKWAGGIGLHIHNVRASGSHIRGTNGSSNGIVPMLRVFNHTAKYVDQCLDPDTIVYTKRGILPIKNIVVGDEVITDDGYFYEIGKVLDNDYFGDMYELDIKHTLNPLKLTDMHPLWTIKNDTNIQIDFVSIKNMLDRNLITPAPGFIEVKNINKNDFIGFPIPQYEKDNIHFTEEDCRFYGILLGNGDINNTLNTYCLTLNKEKEANTILFVEEYLSKLNINISYSKKNDNYLTLSWNRTSIFKFTYEMCYDNNKKKNVMPNILHLPKSKILQFIKGILETDGIITDNQITLVMTSKNIIESIRYMLLRLSILTSGAVEEIGEKMNYILYIPTKPIICNLIPEKQLKPSSNFTFFEHDKYLFSIVNKNTLIPDYSGRVIDIEVDNENHHNFLTHNGLVKNGGGRRHGSFAIYLEPWHADIELFLQMRKNHGDEELKARDLFYALWIPDLFMERIKNNGKWTLMCPDECPGLSDVYGEEFDKLYMKYETEGKGRITMNARDLWFQVLDAQMETGTPYLLFKDAVNRKSNQKNVGTIKSSNLCTEITEYSDDTETAVCNLASMALPSYLDHSTEPPTFDYKKLHEVTKVVTENLNRIIDVNYYPTEKTRKSNMRHRPIGIGIQGLADVFIMMDMAFTSEQAKEVNRKIFETMYHAALERSCELAQKEGSYETFVGSPTSQGILQFDMWDFDPTNTRYDWTKMREQIKQYGLRNSLLLAPMPTASTSQILGFNECFEPITSNIYSRRTIAGEFIMTNKYLMRDLMKINLWNEKIKNNIIANNGSIQHIEIIPENIREKYRTVWEIPMKTVIDMAADRGVYICQSQSMNTWVEEPNYNTLTSMHFYSWKKGLKTGMYYLRRRAAHQAQQFTIEPERKNNDDYEDDNEVCEMCSG